MKAWYVKSNAKRYRNKPHLAIWTIPEQHQKGFVTQTEAIAHVMEMQRRIDAGEFDQDRYTFREAFERWLRLKNVKEVTKYVYRTTVNRALGQFLDVPVQDMAVMVIEVQDAVYDDWDNLHLRAIIKGVFDRAMNEGRIAGHRLGLLEGRHKPYRVSDLIPHTADQLNTILANVPDYLRLAILIGRGCGLRRGEVLALETDAIHDGWLEVKRGTINGIDGAPKHRREGEFKPRKVPIPHWLQPEITEHVERFAKNGVLFPAYGSQRSKYVNAATLDRHLRRAAGRAGLPAGQSRANGVKNFTTHQLRKNYATQLRQEAPALGIEWSDVKEWLGHKDLTRDVYAFQGSDAIERGRKLSDPRKESK